MFSFGILNIQEKKKRAQNWSNLTKTGRFTRDILHSIGMFPKYPFSWQQLLRAHKVNFIAGIFSN